MRTTKIKKIRNIGKKKTLDLEVGHSNHNFYAEGLVTSNSHSISYATLSAWTLYLKWNYPKEFFLALLNMSLKEPKPHLEISKITKELSHFGTQLLPPDLLKSEIAFAIEGKNIRFGLAAVKGIGHKKYDTVEKLRDIVEGKTISNKFELFLAAKEVGISIGALSALIQAGAINSIILQDKPRCYAVLEAQVFNLLTPREKRYVLQFTGEFDNNLFELIRVCVEEDRKDEGGKVLIFKPTRWKILAEGQSMEEDGGTIQRKSVRYLEIYKRNREHNRLANWFFEKELLGFSYSDSLFEILKEEQRELKPLSEFDKMEDRERGIFCGSLSEVKRSKSKAKNADMLKLTLDDSDASLKCIFYDWSFNKWIDRNTPTNGKIVLPEDGNIVIAKGSRSNDIIFLSDLSILDRKAYLKLSDLK